MTSVTPPSTTAVNDRLAHAPDAFIGERLPAWLRQASAAQINKLRDSFTTHRQSQEQLRKKTLALIPLEAFARQKFQEGLGELLPEDVSLDDLQWLDVTPRFTRVPGALWPIYGPDYRRQAGLLRLMQNFEHGATFFKGTGLVKKNGFKELSSDPQALAAACRVLDVGREYLKRLDGVFDEPARKLLIADKRAGMKLALEVATLQGHLGAVQRIAMGHLADGSDDLASGELRAQPAMLKVLGCQVADALLVSLVGAGGKDEGVVLYLPSHPTRALRHFQSLDAMAEALVGELRGSAFRGFFSQLIRLADRPGFLKKLTTRLKDDKPDLEPGRVATVDAFGDLVSAQVKRVKDDARLLLVPSAEVDAKAATARLEAWETAGLTIVNLAGFFIPVIGAVLLGQLVAQTLVQVYEGVEDWAHGHQHEALEHLLGVAESLAVAAAVAGGTSIVARGFARSAFVDGLEPVATSEQALRLWSNDLAPYADATGDAVLQDDGLYGKGARRWVHIDGTFYRVHRPVPSGPWRLRHPLRENAYGPALLGNGERGWRLLRERPLEWDDPARMLERLWPLAQGWTAQQARQVLDVAGMDADALRGLLVENRKLPVNLREAIRRLQARQRIDAFFASLWDPAWVNDDREIQDWCLTQPGTQGLDEKTLSARLLAREQSLRPHLFAHLSKAVVADSPLLQLVRRDFPGLSDAYAAEVVAEASDAQALLVKAEGKLPLALASKARSLLQLANLSRVMEGLYLDSEYSNDSDRLAVALLGRLPVKPDALRLELRKETGFGEVLARFETPGATAPVIRLLRESGRVALYDERLQLLKTQAGEPGGIFEAITAALSASQRKALGLSQAAPSTSLRELLLAQLPATRGERMRLLGWQEQTPWFNPGQRLADGRVGYLLSGRGEGVQTPRSMLRQRLRSLYPGLDEQQLDAELERLLQTEGSAYSLLAELEDDYQQLDQHLRNWVGAELNDARRAVRQRLAERLRRAWRLQGEAVRGEDGRVEGLRLSLSGLQVTTLPALPAQVEFSRVTVLVMNETPVNVVHSDFLQAFTALRELNLSRNRLLRVPSGIAYLTDLRRLRLAHNSIRLDNAALQALGGLPGLSHLDLAYNPLGAYAMRYNQLPHLMELNLRACRLGAFPSGIELCGLLERADLRDNQLVHVPDSVLGMPHAYRRSFLVSGNPLRNQDLRGLFALDTIQEHGHLTELPRTIDNAATRAAWLSDVEQASQVARSSLWDSVVALPDSAGLLKLLGLLEHVRDYTEARQALGQRVWALLEGLRDSTGLRTQVFTLANTPLTCTNTVAERFAELQVRLRVDAAERDTRHERGNDLLALGRGLFRLERVERIALQDIRQRIDARETVDQQALSLFYRVRLRERLALPGQAHFMHYADAAEVTATQLEDAYQAVRAAETPGALAESLSQRRFWQLYLQEWHSEAFAELEQVYVARRQVLEGQRGQLLVDEYDLQLETLQVDEQTDRLALFQELTRQLLGGRERGQA
ncbi:NEL-type E3 ubiquitin ligase domain-containing protein [Pseudomonas sp. NPDC089406]|uniref:NEL-type E3 ubiquitin ligase domain-containing protein n=1 Tax=Pseudomonas sp. NPDC089406 TaxID=3364463 RepID=UPI00384CBC3A